MDLCVFATYTSKCCIVNAGSLAALVCLWWIKIFRLIKNIDERYVLRGYLQSQNDSQKKVLSAIQYRLYAWALLTRPASTCIMVNEKNISSLLTNLAECGIIIIPNPHIIARAMMIWQIIAPAPPARRGFSLSIRKVKTINAPDRIAA